MKFGASVVKFWLKLHPQNLLRLRSVSLGSRASYAGGDDAGASVVAAVEGSSDGNPFAVMKGWDN